MACRSLLLRAAATVVSVGVAVSAPSAAVEPGPGWTITIDEASPEAVVASKHLTIRGTASHEAGVDAVTVTLVPQSLPPECSPATGPATIEGDDYVIELEVPCNGPHQVEVEVDADGPTGSATDQPRTVGVAEPPPQPPPPEVDVTPEGGLRATWDPGDDPDAIGSILHVNYRKDHHPAGVDEAVLPPSDRRAAVSVRTLRWGAGGPGTTVSSPESGGTYIAEITPGPDDPPATTPSEPEPEPPSSAPRPRPDVDAASPPPAGRATTAPPAPWPDTTTRTVIRETDPFRRQPVPRSESRAVVAATPPGGVVRTSDDRSPGVAVPLTVLALVPLIAVAIVRVRPGAPRRAGAGGLIPLGSAVDSRRRTRPRSRGLLRRSNGGG